MKKNERYLLAFAMAVALIAAVPALAQRTTPPGSEAPPKVEESFYRLDFVLAELEGPKTVNTRSYSIWLSSGEGRGGGASVRAQNEIPVVTAAAGEKPASVSYRNVGVGIDFRLTESGSGLVLSLSGSISYVVPAEQGSDSKTVLPVFRRIDLNAYTLLTLGKATLISGVDEPGSKRRYELQVTATRLK